MTTVFDAYARYYDLLYQDKHYQDEAEMVHRLIQEHRPASRSRLDVGCGTGTHAMFFAQFGYQVVGLDRSSQMLEVAERK